MPCTSSRASIETWLSVGNSYWLSRIRLCQMLAGRRAKRVNGALVDGLNILGLERGPPDHQGIEDNTNRPGVHFEAMSVRSIEEDFRSNVVGGTADCLLPLPRALDECSETEIPDLDIHVTIEK